MRRTLGMVRMSATRLPSTNAPTVQSGWKNARSCSSRSGDRPVVEGSGLDDDSLLEVIIGQRAVLNTHGRNDCRRRSPICQKRQALCLLAPVLPAPDNETVIRRTTAVAAAKAAAALSRRFRFGGGSALPGLVAERIDPDLVAVLASELGQGSLLVTGTNGKTTTARLVRSIARAAGLEVVANRTGSNMMRGIGSALVEAADWSGEMASAERRLGIFEVDEATLPHAARGGSPAGRSFHQPVPRSARPLRRGRTRGAGMADGRRRPV